jgi:hypothetical protein
VVDTGISVDQDVTERDNVAHVGNSVRQSGVKLVELAQCLADDFKFPLHGRLDNLGLRIDLKFHSRYKFRNRIGGLLNIP